jgi:hypothetical protein
MATNPEPTPNDAYLDWGLATEFQFFFPEQNTRVSDRPTGDSPQGETGQAAPLEPPPAQQAGPFLAGGNS